MSDIKETAVTEVFKYRPVKYLITIILFVLVVIIIYTSANHIYRCYNNKKSSLFWGMSTCEECKADTIRLTSEKIIQDSSTPRQVVYVKQQTKSVPATYQHAKIITDTVKNYQKVDSGNAFQNNAPNYGTQAGRDVNNYGTPPRTVSKENLGKFISIFPDKNTPISVGYIGNATSEMREVKARIINLLQQIGYNNVSQDENVKYTLSSGRIYFDTLKNKSAIFWIPPQ